MERSFAQRSLSSHDFSYTGQYEFSSPYYFTGSYDYGSNWCYPQTSYGCCSSWGNWGW